MGQKWSKKQHVKYMATLKRKKLETVLGLTKEASPRPVEQQAAVDVRHVEQWNYRRGLMAALDCIMRELRDAY